MGTADIIENPAWDFEKKCMCCGSPYIQMHHVFYGTANRKVSDQYGYIIPLCPDHHIGGNGIHRNRGMDLYWKETAQHHFEKHKGTREEFIKLFGKSWL